MSVLGSAAFEIIMVICCALLFWFIYKRRRDTINAQLSNIRSQFTHGSKSPEINESSSQQTLSSSS